MNLKSSWLVQGFFQVSVPSGGKSVTQHVRDSLAARLGRPVRIAQYPARPGWWRHTFWWREGNLDYAEAQFFAHIAEEYPVLSVGISVEKGFEDIEAAAPTAGGTDVMDRKTWDWQRLMERAADEFRVDVPESASLISRPLTLRFDATRYERGKAAEHERRAFVFRDGAWFERHRGTATEDKVVDHLRYLNERNKWWVDAYFACDLSPEDVDGMSPEALASLLWNFTAIRQRLRSNKS